MTYLPDAFSKTQTIFKYKYLRVYCVTKKLPLSDAFLNKLSIMQLVDIQTNSRLPNFV